MKTCFKCGHKKELFEFYRHKMMADGHLNKCKNCTKSDVLANRLKNIEKIRDYDRKRGSRRTSEDVKKYRLKYPLAYKAHTMVAYHLRAGNIVKKPCEVCGIEKSVAHHDDYNAPLDVRWMCQEHHKQWHSANGPGKNAK